MCYTQSTNVFCGDYVMNISKMLLKTLSVTLIFLAVFCAGTLTVSADDNSTNTTINSMTVVPEYDADTHTYNSAYVVLCEQKQNEDIVKKYLSQKHSTSDKDKVFEAYYDLLLSCCNFFNNVNWNVPYETKSVSYWNERFSKGYKDIFGDSDEKSIHVTPTMKKSHDGDVYLSSLNITYPQVPFMKLVYASEGSYKAEVNYKYLNKTYSKYLGPEMKDFLKNKLKEEADLEGHTYYNDGRVTLTKTQLNNWIIMWQNFRKNHPNFMAKEVDMRLNIYTSDFVLAYENSFYMTFDGDNKLLPEAQKDYETFLKSVNPDTPEYKFVKKCYEIIKENNYTFSKSLSTYMEAWGNKYCFENAYEILD